MFVGKELGYVIRGRVRANGKFPERTIMEYTNKTKCLLGIFQCRRGTDMSEIIPR